MRKKEKKPRPRRESKPEPEWTPLNRPLSEILEEVKEKPFYYPPQALADTP